MTVPGWLDTTAYPFEPHWADLPAGRVHYIDEGRGDTILFVHGTPTWSFEWRHLIRAFSASYRCVAPDLLGFGLSQRPRDFPYTPESHAQALATFVDAIGPGDFTLAVHDYGGPIGLPLCIERPERVKRLMLFNTWMWNFDDDADMVRKGRMAGGRLGRWMYRNLNFPLRVLTPHAYGDRRKLTPDIHRQYLAPFPDRWSRGAVLWPLAHALLGSSAFYRSLWERRDRLRGRPALVVWGTKDPAFQLHQLARWRDVLPDARVVELPVGHWPHEEAPNEVIGAVRGFLRQ